MRAADYLRARAEVVAAVRIATAINTSARCLAGLAGEMSRSGRVIAFMGDPSLLRCVRRCQAPCGASCGPVHPPIGRVVLSFGRFAVRVCAGAGVSSQGRCFARSHDGKQVVGGWYTLKYIERLKMYFH